MKCCLAWPTLYPSWLYLWAHFPLLILSAHRIAKSYTLSDLITSLSPHKMTKQWQASEGKAPIYKDVRFSRWVSRFSRHASCANAVSHILFPTCQIVLQSTSGWPVVMQWWDGGLPLVVQVTGSSCVLCNQGLRKSWSCFLQWVQEGSLPPPYTQGGFLQRPSSGSCRVYSVSLQHATNLINHRRWCRGQAVISRFMSLISTGLYSHCGILCLKYVSVSRSVAAA